MSKQSQVKVIVLGDSGVGKSSILLRFINDEFNEFSDPTLGAAFLSKVHTYGNNKSIRLQMWDTAGQEKYKSIAPIYYRGSKEFNLDSQVALCVYDITSKHSFEVLKNWVKELQSQGPKDLILAIVGNKTDKVDHEEVPYDEAKKYAANMNAIFRLTSAKEGKGINELFTSIAQKLDGKGDKNISNQGNNSNNSNPNNQNPNSRVSLDNKNKPKAKKKCCGQ